MKGQSRKTMIARVPQVSHETESSILDLEPDAEGLDWICYRVRGGRDPAGEAVSPRSPALSSSTPGERPAREDVERALHRLEDLGMLSCAGRRWSITAKGHAAIDPPDRPRAPQAPRPPPPASAQATGR